MTRAHRSFPRTHPVVGALVAAVLGLGLAVSPPTPAQAGPGRFTCLGANGLGSSQGNTPANLMAGRVTIPGFGVTTIGTGHVNFSRLNVGNNPTWQLWFNSLKWLEPFMTAASAGQAEVRATYLAVPTRCGRLTSRRIPRSPVVAPVGWGSQAASLRAATVACLAKYRPTPGVRALADHDAAHLSSDRNYVGDWNHGLEENIGLLAVGLRLPPPTPPRRLDRDRVGSRPQRAARRRSTTRASTTSSRRATARGRSRAGGSSTRSSRPAVSRPCPTSTRA